MATTRHARRRVRALKTVYAEHIVRKEGDEFTYGGEPNPDLFLELSQGDTSPVGAGVPRTKTQRGFVEPPREGEGDDIDSLL